MKTDLVLANCADPDEMPPFAFAAFHLGLHCLLKYLFTIYSMKKLREFQYLTDTYVLLISTEIIKNQN